MPTINEQISDLQRLKYKMMQKLDGLTDQEIEAVMMWDALQRPVPTSSPMLDHIMDMKRYWK